MKKFSNKFLLRTVLIGGIVIIFLPLVVLAQTDFITGGEVCIVEKAEDGIKQNFSIPGVTTEIGGKFYVKNLGCYIIGIYRYFVSIAGILATVMIMWGGVQYVVSFGNQQKVSAAKDTITAALVGLLLAMSSYAILFFINPNLTQFALPGIEPIPRLSDGWCEDRELIEGPLTPKYINLEDCGDIGFLEGTNQNCYYEGDKCGDEYSSKVCTEDSENLGRFECKNRVFEWERLNFCYQRPYQNCGILIKGVDNECTGLACNQGSVCIGLKDVIPAQQTTCNQSTTMLYPEDNIIYDVFVNDKVECGLIKKTTNSIGGLVFLVGNRCEDNRSCIIMPLSDTSFFQEGDFRPPDPEIVGSYIENYCY